MTAPLQSLRSFPMSLSRKCLNIRPVEMKIVMMRKKSLIRAGGRLARGRVNFTRFAIVKYTEQAISADFASRSSQ